jgi:Ni/Co efflux regulator RcnB
MNPSVTYMVLSALLVNGAALAGTDPQGGTDHGSPTTVADQRGGSQGTRGGNWTGSNTSSSHREANDRGDAQRGGQHDGNRGIDQGRRNDTGGPTRDQGQRREFVDPRPNPTSRGERDHGDTHKPPENTGWQWSTDRGGSHDHYENGAHNGNGGEQHWSTDHGSDPGDGRHDGDSHRDQARDDRDRDQDRNHWNKDHNHDWHHEQGWYDRYRADHFRFYGGRYFAWSRYFIGYYYVPSGYMPRVWIVGEWLPSAYMVDGQYVLEDYWRFDLYDPPIGCRWIRVGSDALLVDIETGEIIDAVYNVFW